MGDWLFEETLTFGNPTSRVGLVTLWTHQKRYAGLDRRLFRVMGNLYSDDGVNYLARNILAHPEIRCLVICGSDGITHNTGVRQALLSWHVTDPLIPTDEVAWLKANVQLSQCEMEELPAHLAAVERRPGYASLPRKAPATFPFKSADRTVFPSEISGMRVLWSSVYDAWTDALRHVLRFGVMEGRRKVLLNLVSVVDGDDDRLPLHVSPKDAASYAAQFLSPRRDERASYTYGNRILAWGEGMNLLERAIARLERDPLSSRCVIDLWDNRLDVDSDEPPCLTQIILNIVGGDLYLTGLFRSHDLYGAYFLNLYALREMQRGLADQLSCGLGKLTTVSTHAHIYEWDLEKARQAVEAAERPKCVWDPRGNLALTRRGCQWVAILYSPDGRQLQEYRARTRERLLSDLIADHALSQPSHYVYVAKELYANRRRPEELESRSVIEGSEGTWGTRGNCQ